MTYLKLELDMMLIFVYDNIGQDWTSLDKFKSLDKSGHVKPKRRLLLLLT